MLEVYAWDSPYYVITNDDRYRFIDGYSLYSREDKHRKTNYYLFSSQVNKNAILDFWYNTVEGPSLFTEEYFSNNSAAYITTEKIDSRDNEAVETYAISNRYVRDRYGYYGVIDPADFDAITNVRSSNPIAFELAETFPISSGPNGRAFMSLVDHDSCIVSEDFIISPHAIYG